VVISCVFCACHETIQHLFFDCHFARFLWRAVQVTFNIVTPTFVVNLFNGWANGVGKQFKKLVLVGAAALCWALWTSRNNVVFDNSPFKTYMQVLYRGTYWLQQWAQLQRHEEHAKELMDACSALETTVMQVFIAFGWRFSNRITTS
jgi:hypothetical protein